MRCNDSVKSEHRVRSAVIDCGVAALSVCLLFFGMSPVFSQSMSEGAAALVSPALVGPTTIALASAELERGSAGDMIAGNGSPGPYVLGWNNILPNNESVIIDGRQAIRSIDFNIDHAKGLIAFTAPLKATSLARVDYRIDAKRSMRNTGSFAVPLSLSLLSSGSSSLQMTALYKQGDNSGASVLGLQGNTLIGSATKLTSSLYFGQGQSGYDIGQRTAAKLGLTTRIGNFALTGSYLAAGQAFAGAKDYGLTTGQGAQTLGIAWAPEGSRLSFDSSYNRLGAENRNTSTLTNHLGYKLSPNSSFLYSRQAMAKDGLDTVTNEWKLDNKFGKATSAQFVWSDKATPSDSIRSQYLAVDTTALTNTLIGANLRITDSVTHGATNTLNVAVKSEPAKIVAMTAAFNAKTTEIGDDTTSVNVGLKATPSNLVQLQMGFAGHGSALNGSDNAANMRIAATPVANVKLSAGISDRQTSLLGSRTRDIRIDSKPFSFLTLGAGYGYTDDATNTAVVKDVDAVASPWASLKLNGQYKTREIGTSSLDSVVFGLAYDPWKNLGIRAAFSDNPEDNKGVIQPYASRSLGLKAHLGALSMTGDFAFKDEHATGQQWIQRRLGMAVSLAAATQLTGGYEFNEAELMGSTSSRFSLGVRRDLGSDFNLSLSGAQITDSSYASDARTRYEANVKLGLKF